MQRQRKSEITVEILQVETERQLTAVKTLFRQYFDWLAEVHHIDMTYQAVEAELAALPGYYAPPEGRLLLVQEGETPLGCGALRPLAPGIVELKRMYVVPTARRNGVGRAIALRLLDESRLAGYQIARLDTATFLPGAIALYHSIGFRDRDPYYQVPEDVFIWTVFMELDLSQR